MGDGIWHNDIWHNDSEPLRLAEKNAESIFFTSDTHFNHANILGFCARPFKDIREHDEELVRRWNMKVPKDGLVFHLGDVCFGTNDYCRDILNSLNGIIYLIVGNHDMDTISKFKDRFCSMVMQRVIIIGDQNIVLNHFPFACMAGSYRKRPVWQLYGHVHTSPYLKGVDSERIDSIAMPCQYDVGVDNNHFTPLSYTEVKEIMKRRLDTGQAELRKKLEKYN